MQTLRTPDERFAGLPDFDFDPHYAEVAAGDGGSLRVHYLREGAPDAPVVLLMHGEPSWSYLYRKMIPVLTSAGLQVVAPDLVGFGRSDKPASRTAHSVHAHIAWIMEFVVALRLRDVTLVVQDWGGPFGLGVLAERPDLFRAVVAANTALHTADADLAGRLTWACHAAADGTVVVEQSLLDYQRLTQELTPFAPSLFVQGATESPVADSALAAYDAPFPDERYCAGPRQLPLLMGLTPASACARRNARTTAALREFRGPFLTAFSDGDPATRGWAEVLRAIVPGAARESHVTIAGAGHFLQEDRGEELADQVARLVAG